MDSKKRPSSVTVISWIIIVISVIDGLISFSVMVSGNNSLGLSSSTIKWAFISDIIYISLALGILKGLNWCRITYLIFYPIKFESVPENFIKNIQSITRIEQLDTIFERAVIAKTIKDLEF